MKGKIKVGFSIDSSTNDDFNEYCEAGSINKSKLVNKLLKEFLKKEKENNESKNNRTVHT